MLPTRLERGSDSLQSTDPDDKPDLTLLVSLIPVAYAYASAFVICGLWLRRAGDGRRSVTLARSGRT